MNTGSKESTDKNREMEQKIGIAKWQIKHLQKARKMRILQIIMAICTCVAA